MPLENTLPPFLPAIFFFLCVTGAYIAFQYLKFRKQQAKIDFIRSAMEKGQPIDIELTERILQSSGATNKQSLRPDQVIGILGIVLIAAGAGLALLGYFLSHIAEEALYALFGVGSLVGCVGAGCLVAAKAIKKPDTQPDSPR
jgi:hypothetical protein